MLLLSTSAISYLSAQGNKKSSDRTVTEQRAMSVEILSTAAQLYKNKSLR